MTAQWITGGLIILGAAALCAPRQDTPAAASKAEPAVLPATGSSAIVEAANTLHNGRQTSLTRDEDGHFYADVRVDGRKVEMLVDTGASFIALTPGDANAAGVNWHESDAVIVGSGASGPVRGVPVVLDRVELGDHRAHDLRAAVIVDGLGKSLLGQNFLGKIETVRIEGDTMLLGKD